MLIPITKKSNEAMPNMCKLAFILANKKINAKIVLTNPARK